MCIVNHPTLELLIKQFKIEQTNTEILYAQLLSGDEFARNKSMVTKDEAILNTCKAYQKDNLWNFINILILQLAE